MVLWVKKSLEAIPTCEEDVKGKNLVTLLVQEAGRFYIVFLFEFFTFINMIRWKYVVAVTVVVAVGGGGVIQSTVSIQK